MIKKIFVSVVYKYIFLFWILFVSFYLPAQSQTIRIGDDLSDLVFSDVRNYPADSLKVSDHQGKLIILDFWNVLCGSCIANMPAMHRLQETFRDDIQIILVSDDDEVRMERALERNSNIRNISLPSSINNGDLFKQMPFRTLPSHVWLDQHGVVKYIAAGGHATEANVRAFLDGRDLMLPLKSEIRDFDSSKPLWLEGNGRHTPKLQYYSYLMDRLDLNIGMLGINKDRESGKVNQIKAINQSLLTLIKVAYGEGSFVDNPFWEDKRIILNVIDPKPFNRPQSAAESERWVKQYTYCYELKVPVSKTDKIYEFMQRDLNMYFGLRAEIIEVEKEIHELILLDSTLLMGDGVTQAEASKTFNHSETTLHLNNMPLSRMVEELLSDYRDTEILFIDSLPDLKSVSLALNLGKTCVPELRERLNSIGIDVIQKRQKIPMLRIYD